MARTKICLRAIGRSFSDAILRFLVVLTILHPMLRSDGYLFDCIRLPKPPLHGRVRYLNGTITARLKCDNDGLDVALNSPGQGGILTCSKDNVPFDFLVFKPLDCLKYKMPDDLRMPAKFMFALADCQTQAVLDVKNKVKKILESLLPRHCSTLVDLGSCYWGDFETRCGRMYNANLISSKRRDFSMMVAVNTELILSPYVRTKTVQQYQDELGRIRETYLGNFSLPGEGDVQTVELLRATFFKTWKSGCTRYKEVADGSVLGFHRVASCRGCPSAYRYDPDTRSCWLCDRGFYTSEPFSNLCVPCPPVDEWDSLESYVKMCGSLK